MTNWYLKEHSFIHTSVCVCLCVCPRARAYIYSCVYSLLKYSYLLKYSCIYFHRTGICLWNIQTKRNVEGIHMIMKLQRYVFSVNYILLFAYFCSKMSWKIVKLLDCATCRGAVTLLHMCAPARLYIKEKRQVDRQTDRRKESER